MKYRTMRILIIGLFAKAAQLPAITPSNDLIIPGAVRTSLWLDDLYISNPGNSTVTVDVIGHTHERLVRDRY